MLVRQLFDPESSTYTYVVADREGGQGVVIDPVKERVDEVLAAAAGLTIAWSLETHTHADHVTAASLLRDRLGAKLAVHHLANACECSDRSLVQDDVLTVGGLTIRCLETPGHTPDGVCYLVNEQGGSAPSSGEARRASPAVFTGDTLLIGTCGRTDFQGGDPGALYDAIHGRLFTLPDEVIVYPAHDYCGQKQSTIGSEKLTNKRAANRSRDEFVALMNSLNLPPPKKIAEAVPANQRCGLDGTPHGA